WATVLPLVQRIVNATFHTSLGVAPRELVFGTRLALERNALDGKTRWNTTTANYIRDLNDSLEEVVAASQLHLAGKLDDRVQYRVSMTGNSKEFKPRDYVVIEKHGDIPSVLNAHKKGPYLVIERRRINNYLLRDLETNKEFEVHADRMTLFTGDLSSKDIQKLSNMDRDEGLVVKVLRHKLIKTNAGHIYTKKKDIHFELEYDDGSREFVPYASCKYVEAVKLYIKNCVDLKGIFCTINPYTLLPEEEKEKTYY
ncbi:MAG: hypothetical protein FD167_5546, partial [bacterium]